MNTEMKLIIATALTCAGATGANAQANSGPSAPLPGSGNSAAITSANRDNNAAYNQLIGAADGKRNTEAPGKVYHAPVAATAADIKPGAPLRDIKGAIIGKIVSVDASQAVVDTGQTKIGVPLNAFGKDDSGLLLGMTAEKFNALVAQAHARSQASN